MGDNEWEYIVFSTEVYVYLKNTKTKKKLCSNKKRNLATCPAKRGGKKNMQDGYSPAVVVVAINCSKSCVPAIA